MVGYVHRTGDSDKTSKWNGKFDETDIRVVIWYKNKSFPIAACAMDMVRKNQQWQNHGVVVSLPGFGKQNIVQYDWSSMRVRGNVLWIMVLEKYSVVFNHSIAYTQVDWILALKYYLCCDKLDYWFRKKYLNLSVIFYSLFL